MTLPAIVATGLSGRHSSLLTTPVNTFSFVNWHTHHPDYLIDLFICLVPNWFATTDDFNSRWILREVDSDSFSKILKCNAA